MLGYSFGASGRAGSANPVLTSMNYDVADSAGGGSITITGTNIGNATRCTVGGTSVAITSNTSTSLTFTMPAKAAGIYDVVVSLGVRVSNALPLIVEADPIVWLSADRATTTTGPVVTGIPNSATSSVDLSVTQLSGVKRPGFDATYDALNDRPSIIFDGTTKTLKSNILGSPIAQPITVYVVARPEVATTSFLFDAADSSNRLASYLVGGQQIGIYAGAGVIYGGPSVVGHPVVLCLVIDSSSAAYLGDATTPIFAGMSGSNALASLALGVEYDEIFQLDGAIAILGAFEGAHDETTRARILAHLRNKYAPTDIAGIAHDGLWLANFSASPWVAWPSLSGASATKTLSEPTNPPTQGTAVNGLYPAQFNGTDERLTFSGTLGDYMLDGDGKYSGWLLVNIDAIGTDSSTPYENDAILTESASYWFIYLRSSGIVGLQHYDGIGPSTRKVVTASISTGSLHFIQWRYDGTNIQLRVDSGTWQSTPAAPLAGGAGNTFYMGANYAATHLYDGAVYGVGSSKGCWDDSKFDNIKARVNARFGVSL